MGIETEIRALIPDPERAIGNAIQLGFVPEPSFDQHDIMFDRSDGSMFRSGSKIRIRVERDRAELTYKGSFLGDASASRRTELNVPLSVEAVSSTSAFLEAIGFPMLFQVKKTRLQLKKGSTKITIDRWPIIGNLMEIEGAEPEIGAFAEQICPDVDFGGYRLKKLFADTATSTGKSIEELKFDYERKTGFKLGNIEFLID